MSTTREPNREASRTAKLVLMILFILAVALFFGAALLESLAPLPTADEESGGWLIGLAFVLLAAVGALAALGQPRNVTGWVLLVCGLAACSSGFGAALAVYLGGRGADPQWSLLVGWLSAVSWYTALLLLLAIFPYLFPTGRLPVGRIWRPIFLADCLFVAGIIGAQFVSGLVLIVRGASKAEVEQMQGAIASGFLFIFLFLLLGVISSVIRYRQSGAETRVRLKWLLFTLGITFVSLTMLSLLQSLNIATVSNLVWGTLYLFIPLGLGVALLRYRLFDVDTVLRRGTAYAILTMLLGLTFWGVVTMASSFMARYSEQTSPVVVVIATLATAALFNPLYRRIQAFVDRRFYRRKYDARQVLAHFAVTARDETNVNALAAELARVVQETFEPAQLTILLLGDGELRRSDRLTE